MLNNTIVTAVHTSIIRKSVCFRTFSIVKYATALYEEKTKKQLLDLLSLKRPKMVSIVSQHVSDGPLTHPSRDQEWLVPVKR